MAEDSRDAGLVQELACIKNTMAQILSRQEQTENTIKELLVILRGTGRQTGVLATIEKDSELLKKHEAILCGNGKEGIVERFRAMERAWSTSSKIWLAFIFAAVGALGSAITTFVTGSLGK
jgi:hypothetical protein